MTQTQTSLVLYLALVLAPQASVLASLVLYLASVLASQA
jgi:hypothetical protein